MVPEVKPKVIDFYIVTDVLFFFRIKMRRVLRCIITPLARFVFIVPKFRGRPRFCVCLQVVELFLVGR